MHSHVHGRRAIGESLRIAYRAGYLYHEAAAPAQTDFIVYHDLQPQADGTFLGHTSPATTQIYTHVSSAQARKVYLAAHPRARTKREGDEAE